jgi:LacI family transcriptional regulator
MDDRRIAMLNALGLPFVVHGRATDVAEPYAWVDVNNKRAFERATNFLLDLGHSRIALINGNEEMDFAKRRRSGYLDALAARAISPDPALMRSAAMTEVYGHHEARDMLQLENRPTAILTGSMTVALGVSRAIQEAGLKMGRDVSVVTFDDDLSYLQNGLESAVFTAVRSSVRDAGRHAGELLVGMITEKPSVPPTLMLEAELVVGGSTGPAPT